MNLDRYAVALDAVGHVARDLSRPECILAQANGTLWIADDRSAVLRLDPDGAQTRIGSIDGVPNGIAMDRDGSFAVADIESGLVRRVHRDGRDETVLDALDGTPLGAVNFVLFDSKWRLWVSVSTRTYPRRDAIAEPRPDGYVMMIADGHVRIVADGLWFTNEVRFNADETVLHVAETTRGRVLAFDVAGDGTLSNRRVYGPDRFWEGAKVDGIAMDADGVLWVTEITRHALCVIAPDGAFRTALEDPSAKTVDFPTSITFGGPDLRDAWVGSLRMDRLPRFRSPSPGLAPPHWRLD